MKSKSDRVTKHHILIITIHDETLNEHTDEISRDDTAKENVPINIDCVNGHKEDKHADNENIVMDVMAFSENIINTNIVIARDHRLGEDTQRDENRRRAKKRKCTKRTIYDQTLHDKQDLIDNLRIELSILKTSRMEILALLLYEDQRMELAKLAF